MLFFLITTYYYFILLLTNVIECRSVDLDENVSILLSTKNWEKTAITDSNIYRVDTTKSTIFIIPGWKCDPNEQWVVNMTEIYLKSGDYNVFVVHWANYSFSNYLTSYRKVKQVGEIVSNVIMTLSGESEKFLDKVHVVGHSLGAHVAGYVGYKVYREAFYKLSRITGLDPAKPLYEMPLIGRNEKYRLSSNDARFVDVIHTNGGFLGFDGVVGHADFYPNGGGPNQPGCGLLDEICSHQRAYVYFTESIESRGFTGRRCRSWNYFEMGKCWENDKEVMGQHVSLCANGKYFLKTNAHAPFSIVNN